MNEEMVKEEWLKNEKGEGKEGEKMEMKITMIIECKNE